MTFETELMSIGDRLLDEKGKTEKSKDKLKTYDDHITTIRKTYVDDYAKTFKEQSKKI
jgi:hypothetical protein